MFPEAQRKAMSTEETVQCSVLLDISYFLLHKSVFFMWACAVWSVYCAHEKYQNRIGKQSEARSPQIYYRFDFELSFGHYTLENFY